MKYMPGVAVIDVEATSLDKERGAIVSIGMVAYKNGRVVRSYRAFRPFRGADLNSESMAISGVKRSDFNVRCNCRGGFKSCMVMAHMHDPSLVPDYVSSFMKANGCHTVAGQNTSFDRDYIDAYFRRYRRFNWLSFRTIDMHSIAAGVILSRGGSIPLRIIRRNGRIAGRTNHLSATQIYKMLGLPKEPEPHNALTGALIEFEAYCRLLYNRSVVPEFRRYKVKRVSLRSL